MACVNLAHNIHHVRVWYSNGCNCSCTRGCVCIRLGGFNRRANSLAVVLLLLPFINVYGVYGLELWHSWVYNVAR